MAQKLERNLTCERPTRGGTAGKSYLDEVPPNKLRGRKKEGPISRNRPKEGRRGFGNTHRRRPSEYQKKW